MTQSVRHEVLEVILRQIHVVLQVGEGHLRLDHPKLRQVSRGVAVLCAESGPERVHVPEGARMGFHVELSRHRQAGAPSEKVLREEEGGPASERASECGGQAHGQMGGCTRASELWWGGAGEVSKHRYMSTNGIGRKSTPVGGRGGGEATAPVFIC